MTLVDLVRTGITPAYAGKRGWMRATEVTRKDHPRVCGEKAYSLVINGSEWGSPPRMRGKACTCSCASIAGRITPAYAGKSPGCGKPCGKNRDHPRVCGEKSKTVLSPCTIQGSPPRMRGKVCRTAYHRRRNGITPAYAGKRTTPPAACCPPGDHPRVCGEKRQGIRRGSCEKGSPPRMRGKVRRGSDAPRRGGITPAYAGKRLKRSHSIGHFSCILCLFHSVLHRASASGGSRAGPCAPPCLPAQNAVPV